MQDIIQFTFNHNRISGNLTKRKILSSTARTFDPLGLLSPVTIIPKLLIQSLWKLKLDCDQSIPEAIENEFRNYNDTLHTIHTIKISRHICSKSAEEYHLDSFSDASEKPYGSCIYIKSINRDGSSQVALIAAKSRVAPVKQITLPRLELCGAVLLAQLAERVCNALDITFNKKYFWTDFQITLAWIKASSSRWKTFVANRVEVQRLTEPQNWFQVSTKENPVYLISRGLLPQLLENHPLWWQGPQFLLEDIKIEFSPLESVNIPEEKSVAIVSCSTQVDYSILSRYSDFNKLVNVVAYCGRFIDGCKGKRIIRDILSSAERKEALKGRVYHF